MTTGAERQGLRLLHVGSGFRPWRLGGLVAYIEDLMAEQVRRGHQVTYFFSGRHYPYVNGPRLRRWERDGVAMLEVVNSPLHDHGRQPELELAEPRIERMLGRVIEELRPDVVHVQELAGLPSSVLDVVRVAGVPAILALQDYFPLCSTFKLLDSEGKVCLRQRVGADCVATTAADARPAGLLVEATLLHDLARLPLVRRIDAARRDRHIERVARSYSSRVAPTDNGRPRDRRVQAAAFERRREVNLERLNRVDYLIAMSDRVAEIYSQLGIEPSRLRTLTLTLAHIERLRPREPDLQGPITFATLGGFESVAKGGRVIIDAMRLMSDLGAAKRFRLLAFGFLNAAFKEEVDRLPGLEVRGPYPPHALDSLLDEVDVGIMPSIWEEAHGFAGIEFLAKGVPVIANAMGGMVEYTREGETGWLNRSCSSNELAQIMSGVLERPQQVAELNAKLRAERHSIVKPMARHEAEMDALYREVILARA